MTERIRDTLLGARYNPKSEKRWQELNACWCYNPKIKSLEEANNDLYSTLIVPVWCDKKTCSAIYYRAAGTQKSEESRHYPFHGFVTGFLTSPVQKTTSGERRQRDFGEEDCLSSGVTHFIIIRRKHVEWVKSNVSLPQHMNWMWSKLNDIGKGNETSLIAALQLKHRRSCFHKHTILQEPGLHVASPLQEKKQGKFIPGDRLKMKLYAL